MNNGDAFRMLAASGALMNGFPPGAVAANAVPNQALQAYMAQHAAAGAIPFGIYPNQEMPLGPVGCFMDNGYPGFHPYALGMDGARRKNATREVTMPLKQWLNDHRRNPYPTKAEKMILAIVTKMTLTQVSTWFANARRRLKKENKMTWSPRNRNGEDDDDDDDARDDAERPSSSQSGSSDQLKKEELNLTGEDGEQKPKDAEVKSESDGSPRKSKIWSIDDIQRCPSSTNNSTSPAADDSKPTDLSGSTVSSSLSPATSEPPSSAKPSLLNGLELPTGSGGMTSPLPGLPLQFPWPHPMMAAAMRPNGTGAAAAMPPASMQQIFAAMMQQQMAAAMMRMPGGPMPAAAAASMFPFLIPTTSTIPTSSGSAPASPITSTVGATTTSDVPTSASNDTSQVEGAPEGSPAAENPAKSPVTCSG